MTRHYRQTLLSVTMCYRLTLCVTKSAGLESYQQMLSQWSAPQYGLCQGLFVAHTSIAVTADPFPFSWPCESIQFTGHNEVEENMATVTFQVCGQHGIPSIELQDIQTTGKQDKATYCTIKLKVT